MAAVAQHSSDLILLVDQTGTVLYANPAAARIVGVPLEQANGTPAFDYVHPDDLEGVRAGFAVLLDSPGASMNRTVRFRDADGAVRAVETTSTNCLDNPAVAAIAINGRDVTDRDQYMTKLQASFDAATEALAKVAEFRDPYTAGHQREVAHIAAMIAHELGVREDEVKGIAVAATIHDVGKIVVPAEILNRPGRLSPSEFEIIKTHSQVGHDIVAGVDFPWPVAEYILQHHERLDGSGYPRSLRESAILPGSRIIAVADVVSAITGHRPYRPALGLEQAMAEIEAHRGLLYDPTVVDACLRLFRDGHLELTPGRAA